MREAVGGSLLLYLIIPIIILFICFIGFIMNYASAYRSANYIVTQIENCQGQFNSCDGVNMSTIIPKIREEYRYIVENDEDIKLCYFVNGNNTVFRVKLRVSFDLPLYENVGFMDVKAETKSISNVPDYVLNLYQKCT